MLKVKSEEAGSVILYSPHNQFEVSADYDNELCCSPGEMWVRAKGTNADGSYVPLNEFEQFCIWGLEQVERKRGLGQNFDDDGDGVRVPRKPILPVDSGFEMIPILEKV